MSGTATFLITVGVAVGVLLAFFLIYYLGSIANTIYEMKVQTRREVDAKLEDMRKYVEKELAQRTLWIRNEAIDQGKESRKEMTEAIDAHRLELSRLLEKTDGEVVRLKRAVVALQNMIEPEAVTPPETEGKQEKKKDGGGREGGDAADAGTAASSDKAQAGAKSQPVQPRRSDYNEFRELEIKRYDGA